MADRLMSLAGAMGVLPRYKDQMGVMRETTPETAQALLTAMGAAQDGEALPVDVICTAGAVPDLVPEAPWHLTHEDGTKAEGRGALPALPLGIHRLTAGDARFTLLAAPERLPLPAPCWGLIAPLYGLSETGIGRYDDLATLAQGLAGIGAGFLGINPVHAGFPTEPGLFSPYTPSHRRRLNVLHLPGGTGTAGAMVAYARDIPERMAALRTQYEAFEGDADFDAWLTQEGAPLRGFALHQALSDRFGAFWNDWPAALQDPASALTRQASAELAPEIRFHSWLQWRAEAALTQAQHAAKQAGMAHGLYLDLAVGTHPHGAETWEDRASFAFGASLGAPPDAFSTEGQNWGLAPFNPRALRASAYAPLAETLRRQLRFSGILRIDHILGFERAFWVPEGAPGGYVQMPRDAMLAVVRIEAARAGAVVVGEDLGNIPDGLRGALEASGILGCRVAMFERSSWEPPRFRPAKAYDAAAIASFSTHDLPTWQGWRSGADIAARVQTAEMSAPAASAEQAKRAKEIKALDKIIPKADEDALHGFLAATPARLVAVQAEIALGMTEQPNLPGTTTQYPNWQMRLPVPSAALSCHDGVKRAARIMRDAKRGGGGDTP